MGADIGIYQNDYSKDTNFMNCMMAGASQD
jgi:hypothetical protein